MLLGGVDVRYEPLVNDSVSRSHKIEKVPAQNFSCYLRGCSYVLIQLFLPLFSVFPPLDKRMNIPNSSF